MYVKFAYDREINGHKYKAGEVVETDRDTGSVLISRGLAVKTRKPAKQEPEKVTDSQESAKAADTKNSKGESN